MNKPGFKWINTTSPYPTNIICFDPSEQVFIQGLFGAPLSRSTLIFLTRCANSITNNGCAPKSEIDEYLTKPYVWIGQEELFVDHPSIG